MDTHKLLPGVDAGDIGPKLGYSFKDNGFMGFKNYKVPRDALLAKYISVERDGSFVVKGNLLIFYGGMMVIRQTIVTTMSKIICLSVLIALRYSMIRTQFKGPQGLERPIIDYKLQKAKLYPYLAKAYAIHFAGLHVSKIIKKSDENIKNNNFSLLKEIHIILSVFKALFTWWGNDSIFTCMQACGGHGYLESAGFALELHKGFPAVIYEGVNTVL